ncbi:MAG: hypothetical protein GF329_02185 [Candidatus Lokiarchaeota archaeon]|nr:hypothetical protein [Candidatus Lokiarchaeota archaeon]
MIPFEFIKFEKKDRIGKISLNTPDNYNALNVKNLNEVYEALTDCETDDSIRTIIFTGEGKMFSSGGNVKEFLSSIELGTAPDRIADISEILHKCALKIMQIPKVVIGKVRGGAYGAGLNLVLCCDLVYAAKNTILDEAFVNVGLSIDGSGSYTIPRLIGVHKAKEFFWLGQIKASEAEKLGIINKALSDEDLDEFVYEIAKKCSYLPPLNVKYTKKLLNTTFQKTAKEELEDERKIQIKVAGSDDFAEGVRAFFDKRRPKFKGK